MENNQAQQKTNQQEVIARFKEAARTLRKLPNFKIQGYCNSWPEIVYSAREIAFMEQKELKLRATPQAISRMEEAISWLNILNTAEDRKLVWMRAVGVPWLEIAKIFGKSRSTVIEKYNRSILRITNKYLYEDIRRHC